jgi:hypothetical protein
LLLKGGKGGIRNSRVGEFDQSISYACMEISQLIYANKKDNMLQAEPYQ